MIHTDEDDEFDRILRENRLKGQPYHWESDAIKAAVLAEREACARACEERGMVKGGEVFAARIRARGNT
jgi:hypothetical protein